MSVYRSIPALLLIAAAAVWPLAGQAAVYTVGPGCSHSNLQSALTAAAGTPSATPHQVRLIAQEFQVADVKVEHPKADIIIEGGYASCSAASATEITTLRRSTSVSNGRIFQFANALANPLRTITLKRLTLTGAQTNHTIGGAISVAGHLDLRLVGQVTIQNSRANNGGGIGVLSLSVDSPAHLHLEQESSGLIPRISNNEASARGGGIYAVGPVNITINAGTISGNTANAAGGGIALSGEHARLKLARTGAQVISLDNNRAGTATFSATSGLGGAIYSDQGPIEVVSGRDRYQAVQFRGNQANQGGAVYLDGASNKRIPMSFRSSQFRDNIALGKGGAIHAVNGVELTVEHVQEGGMCLAGRILFIPGLPPEAPVHCSRMKGNEARNTGTPNTRGGGAIYLETDPGAPEPARARAHIYRTVFDGNKDPNGWAAAIGAPANTRLTVGASVFVNNHGAPGSAVVDTVGPEALSFNYNTVLDNTTGSLIHGSAQAYNLRGSILWRTSGSSATIGGTPTVSHGDCLLSSRSSDGGINVEPWLDANFTPRGGSPGVDACPNQFLGFIGGLPVYIPPINDLYYNPRNYDVAGVANAGIGANDLGAVEQVDIIYYGGFGTQPHN